MAENLTATEWTIFIYIAAHNNLDPFGLASLNQILNAGSTDRVKLAVFFDGTGGAERFIVGAPGQKLHHTDLGKVNSGDPKLLEDTAKWAFKLCPAKRYGLVLWSHGNGFWNNHDLYGRWTDKQLDALTADARGRGAVIDEQVERGVAGTSMALFRTTLLEIFEHPDPNERAILFDDDSGMSLDTLQLEQVCQSISIAIGQPIDLLGMDACLMGNMEVAYQLRRCVKYMVASEELTPATSWPYHRILPKLIKHPAMPTKELSSLVVDETIMFYDKEKIDLGRAEMALIALDLSGLVTTKGLTLAIKKLSSKLQRHMQGSWQALQEAYEAAAFKETNDDTRDWGKSQCCLADIKSLCEELSERTTYKTIQRAALAVVQELSSPTLRIAEAHRQPWLAGIGGLSIYFPWKAKPTHVPTFSAQYGRLALARDTRWDAMLGTYLEVSHHYAAN